MAQQPAVVIDNGSGLIKAGFSPEHEPTVTIPSVVGQDKQSGDSRVGDAAQSQRDALQNVTWPVERGVITDWDGMEKLWHHVLREQLKVAPNQRPVLLTEPPQNSRENKEKMIQLMFEKFGSPAVFLGVAPVLSLYASGLMAGTVCSSGHGVTNIVPVLDGFAVSNAIQKIDVAGKDLTELLSKSLQEKHGASAAVDQAVANSIKERLGHVSINYDNQMIADPGVVEVKSYDLPDGTTISLDKELIKCPEALFRPSLLGVDSPGIHQKIHSAISACQQGSQKQLYGSVVLAGGSTMFPGLSERLTRELKSLAPSDVTVKVSSPETRAQSAWIGGSVLASNANFQTMWITKQEYEETGPAIASKKTY